MTGGFILKTNYYSKRKISLLAETTNTDRDTELLYVVTIPSEAAQLVTLFELVVNGIAA